MATAETYLILNLVDRFVDGGQQLFPTNSQSLHSVVSKSVLENVVFLQVLHRR